MSGFASWLNLGNPTVAWVFSNLPVTLLLDTEAHSLCGRLTLKLIPQGQTGGTYLKDEPQADCRYISAEQGPEQSDEQALNHPPKKLRFFLFCESYNQSIYIYIR